MIIWRPTFGTFIYCAVLGFVTAASFLLNTKSANALRIGNWEVVCFAPNWKTGELQRVEERSAPRDFYFPWYARIWRLRNGSWRMEFNWQFIQKKRLTPTAQKFVFYHECAHARLNAASERRADCAALRHMREKILLTRDVIRDISQAYYGLRRRFPTGGPCEQEKKPEVEFMSIINH